MRWPKWAVEEDPGLMMAGEQAREKEEVGVTCGGDGRSGNKGSSTGTNAHEDREAKE